jgi:hypothetical protein
MSVLLGLSIIANVFLIVAVCSYEFKCAYIYHKIKPHKDLIGEWNEVESVYNDFWGFIK